MNEQTKATVKNAAVLSARALRRYNVGKGPEALATLHEALAATAEALNMLEHELEGDSHG